jgi:hypothetical protein
VKKSRKMKWPHNVTYSIQLGKIVDENQARQDANTCACVEINVSGSVRTV